VITQAEAKYLMHLYRCQVEDKTLITTTLLAREFKVAPATITNALQKLAKKKLVVYVKYHGVRLTEQGEREARRLLRKHRVLETFFVKFLGYDAKSACEEAARIDYYCSDSLINAMCKACGHPTSCPCNKPIARAEECCRG